MEEEHFSFFLINYKQEVDFFFRKKMTCVKIQKLSRERESERERRKRHQEQQQKQLS
jgi:hypothetical protein